MGGGGGGEPGNEARCTHGADRTWGLQHSLLTLGSITILIAGKSIHVQTEASTKNGSSKATAEGPVLVQSYTCTPWGTAKNFIGGPNTSVKFGPGVQLLFPLEVFVCTVTARH